MTIFVQQGGFSMRNTRLFAEHLMYLLAKAIIELNNL